MSKDKYDVNEILQMVDMYIDKALNEEDKRALMNKIQSIPIYSQLYQQEKDFRTFLKDNVKRPEVSAEFKESLKESLRSI